MFIVKDDEKTGLKLNGAALPSGTTYTAIPNTDYVGGFIEVYFNISNILTRAQNYNASVRLRKT